MSAIDPGHVSLRRATDPLAGLSYLLPPGWRHQAEDLDPPFTASMSNGGNAVVNSGHWDHPLTCPPTKDELIAGAAWLASEHAGSILPFEGARVDVLMEAAMVVGRPAARAGYRSTSQSDAEPTYVRVLVVALSPSLVSFLLGVAPDSASHLIDSVLASATPI